MAQRQSCSTNLYDEFNQGDLDDDDYNNPPTLKLADDVFERDDSEDEEDKEDSEEQNACLRMQFKMDTSKKIGKKTTSNASKPGKKDNKKTGRKVVWPNEVLEDLVDVTAEYEDFKRKLIFTNIPNSKNSYVYNKVIEKVRDRMEKRKDEFKFMLEQTRNKFKKLIAVCKTAALTIKTASGITRFQDQRDFGKWFPKLFALVKSRDSSQPEQAIELPSADSAAISSHKRTVNNNEQALGEDNNGSTATEDVVDASGSEVQSVPVKDLFVPVKGNKRVKKSLQHVVIYHLQTAS